MKIIVTGGAGFIASHVADAYIKAGHKVVVIDNLLTGFKKNVNAKAKFCKADIKDLAAMEKIFSKEKPDAVNHHAAFISVTESVKQPKSTFENNVMGTLNVVLAFGQSSQKPKRLIFSSTGGAIYGNPKHIPADETTPPAPLSPYALSKLMGEETIKFFCERLGIEYLILRYANVYGPRQNPMGEAGVVAIFGNLLKNGVRPTIFGDGTKTRDYVYVGDVARASVLGLTRGRNEMLNICSGKETSDQEIFGAIANAFHAKQKPIYAPFREGEVARIAMNYRKAEKILGWKPDVTLQEGIKKTISLL